MILLATLATAIVVSFLVGWLLVRFEGLHAHLSHDDSASGPQKFHCKPTPRIGGVPVASGLVAGCGVAWAQGAVEGSFLLAFGLSVLPAFASGLIEDVTKKIGPDMRLWASFLSALVAVYFFDAVVARSGVPFVDTLFAWYPLALIFTMVGVGGVAHAVNLIDGYNGLASMVSMLMLGVLGGVCWMLGDASLALLCFALAGGTLGFFVWNFPHGRIFAGDGGAYLWGVTVALVAVLMIQRHPQVSPWFPLLVVIYPVFETLFTIYRRKFKQSTDPGLPDAKHLHQLVYRRLLSVRLPGVVPNADQRTLRNAATSPFLWALAATAILPAGLFWNDTGALIALAAGFCMAYVWLYRAITCFGVPRWLRGIGRWLALRILGVREGVAR